MINKSHHFRVWLSFQDITQSLTISNTTVGCQLLVPITLQARSSISPITLTDQPQDPWLINQAKIRTGKAHSNSAATVASNSQFNFKDYLVCPFSSITRLCQCLIMQFQPRFNEFQPLVPQNPFIFYLFHWFQHQINRDYSLLEQEQITPLRDNHYCNKFRLIN